MPRHDLVERLQHLAAEIPEVQASDEADHAVTGEIICPKIYDVSKDVDQDELIELLAREPFIQVRDTLQAQLFELCEILNPQVQDGQVLETLALRYIASRPATDLWIYFGWKRLLVHCLNPDEFELVRTNRNKHLITATEQDVLKRKTISILGLSVGAATAVTMAMESSGGTFHLADFDELSLSNTNRLRSSIGDIGMRKTLLCARNMLEINPFLTIRVWSRPIDETNIEHFLKGSDLLIELCDDLYLKLFSRLRARKLGIPTIMETSNKGMLDVERFDLDQTLPILHGLLGDLNIDTFRGLTSDAKIGPLLKIIGGSSALSARMAASLLERNQSVKSWPQLAAAIQLGSGIASDTARRVLLGRTVLSNRYFVDLEKLVPEMPTRSPEAPEHFAERSDGAESASSNQTEHGQHPHGTTLTSGLEAAQLPAHIKPVLRAACLAPSGGNTQPWSFVWNGTVLKLRPSAQSLWKTLDFQGRAVQVAIGAAAENATLRALELRYDTRVTHDTSESSPTTILSFQEIESKMYQSNQTQRLAELAKRIEYRHTNRNNHDVSQAVKQNCLAVLQSTVVEMSGSLELVFDQRKIAVLQQILGEMDQICLLHKTLHDELTGEVYDPRTVQTRPSSGISIDDLAMSTAGKIAYGLIRDSKISGFLREQHLGSGIAKTCTEKRTTSYGLLYQQKGVHDYVTGGRTMQRMWLAADAMGLAIHPWSGALYIWGRIESGGGGVFSDAEVDRLADLRNRFRDIFPQKTNETEILLFRLGHAAPAESSRTRYPWESRLTVDMPQT